MTTMRESITMPSKSTVDQRTVAELEAAILDGDLSITAEALAAARSREDHARLLADAAVHRVQLEAQQRQEAELEQLRHDIAALVDDRDDVLALAAEATQALAALFAAARGRGATLDALAGRARALDVTQMGFEDEVRDPSGIGWRRDHTTVGPARIRLADVALGAVDPVKLTARIVRDVFDRAGQRSDGFTLGNAGPPVAEQVAATVREVIPPELVRVRTTRRWGAHPVGAVVEVDHEIALWARSKGYAVPV
jgi:hypothetical protein